MNVPEMKFGNTTMTLTEFSIFTNQNLPYIYTAHKHNTNKATKLFSNMRITSVARLTNGTLHA